ncbi:hypothetical protein BHE74_00005722 [Ensete ventricosum]|nr:hypothetical protein BHE74_00005722 [Ensete ventricosum]
MESFENGAVRLLKHQRSIVEEDYLDRHRVAATGEHVDEVIFLSRHTAVSNHPALTVHPIGTKKSFPHHDSVHRSNSSLISSISKGVPHIREGEPLPQGGRGRRILGSDRGYGS